MQDDTFATLSGWLIVITLTVIATDSIPVWHAQYRVTDKNIWEDDVILRIYKHQGVLTVVALVTTSIPSILTSIDLLMSGIAFIVSLYISLLCMDVSQQFTHRINRLIQPAHHLVE